MPVSQPAPAGKLGLSPQRKELLVNMGPQHPSTHGVLRVLVHLDGERIVDVEPDIGYLHRCFEKLSEGLEFSQVIPYTDRTDYLAALTAEHAFVMAVERLLGVEVPERAQYLRVIGDELQRIASHLLWFGSFALDMGATTPFLYAWRERELATNILEAVSGARLLYNYYRIGGVRNDFPPHVFPMIHELLEILPRRLEEYERLLTRHTLFAARTRGVGVLSPETAIAYGASGPVLRGSGVAYDVRRAAPYAVYDRLAFDIPTFPEGDAYARAMVRLEEMRQSRRILQQALAQLPPGDIVGKVPRRLKPEGDTYARVESPRGEVGCYLVAGGGPRPYRVKWRSPCFVHLQLLPEMSRGRLFADLVVIIGSIDIVMGEVDR